jgi:argininosuccinate lyase
MRNTERLKEIIPRANQCPLGSGALAGNAFGVDREFLTKELGFDGALFEAVDTVKDCIAIMTGVICTMKPNPEMLMKALCPEMLATDLADCLVRKGVLFHETHHISGACVRLAEEQKVSIHTLTLEQLQEIVSRFEEDVLQVWDYEVSVE